MLRVLAVSSAMVLGMSSLAAQTIDDRSDPMFEETIVQALTGAGDAQPMLHCAGLYRAAASLTGVDINTQEALLMMELDFGSIAAVVHSDEFEGDQLALAQENEQRIGRVYALYLARWLGNQANGQDKFDPFSMFWLQGCRAAHLQMMG